MTIDFEAESKCEGTLCDTYSKWRVSNYLQSWTLLQDLTLTIIPRALMGSESIAHETEGRMGYLLRGHVGERNNCLSKVQLVGQRNIETKHLSLFKARL